MTVSGQPNSIYPGGNEPIAIVGSGCRFSGESTTPSKLWQLLRNPHDISSTIPNSRFNVTSFYHPDGLHHGTSNVTESYVLSEDHRHFDATFFGIKPVEASSMDPQQRLLLETVYEGLESAGVTLKELQGSNTAVYVGVMTGDYGDLLNRDVDAFPTYNATGTSRAILSNRVSYFFDWHGPSMTIDTACSSSLIAVHQAVQVLRSGESRVAIAAGTNLILGPEPFIAESKLKMLSPTGRSRMWDSEADGYARGDGIAAVVLKTLSAALADGDHIHCLVRETGINQDGRTKGITMPSSEAQAELIRDTYKRAGLNLSISSERPQFFEAHGTGTPAGDPIEARAISAAFFSGENITHQKLYVGSIKTVLGHTEGTAGLAGVLKAVLAIQHGIIPPNLLFKNLNPAIKPFYSSLQIPTRAIEWPETHGGPRRVSVNSFGFGGANAHAILEQYQPESTHRAMSSPTPVFTPFVFSAATEGSLSSTLQAYSDYIKLNHDSLNANDLSWTLSSRRSTLPYRVAFSAENLDQLAVKLGKALFSDEQVGTLNARSSTSSGPSILGVFTGQGAQWASMGRELIIKSRFAASFVSRLEDSLASLPQSDCPKWSLTKELLADASTSRIREATLSQPLCTAVQVLLVDLLQAAGIKFRAVVGHSSGEIAAAYASGAISTPEAALRIAYYRGLHAGLAAGPEGQKGAMLAIGTSLEDARELCALPDFEGRITVAASNSPSSVTLSGDEDAVLQAKDVFEEEKKFVRLLRVDKAYHSHHMFKASDSYLKSIRAAGIAKLNAPNRSTSWFSSVTVQEITSADDVPDTYWNDNMVNPVLFSEALALAIAKKGPFDLAIEVGPHPALQGPVKQTIQAISNSDISYVGTLRRESNDIVALSDTLAHLWKTLPESSVSFAKYHNLLSGDAAHKLLVGLPSYQWDHNRIFWHESRLSRSQRLRAEPTHEILGTRVADGAPNQLRWRNVLHPREISWLSGHKIQGQIVFPAAAYISAVFEASRHLAGDNIIRLIEVRDVAINQAIPFDDEETSIETLFTLSEIERQESIITASWCFYSAPSGESLDLVLNSNGKLLLELGEITEGLLPARKSETYNLLDLDVDRFYTSLDQVGYHYEGPFRALKNLKRRLGFATGYISKQAATSGSALLIHPGPLDAAIQSVILAFCWPGDGRLKSIHVPTNIGRIRINPTFWLAHIMQDEDLAFDASIAGDSRSGIEGDVDIYTPDRRYNILQIESVLATPFSVPTAADDFHLFSEMVWNAALPDGEAVSFDGRATQEEYQLAYIFERVAYYYLRRLDESIVSERRKALEGHHQSLLQFAEHVISTAATGKHQYIKKQWVYDTHDQILELIRSYPDSIDLRIMYAIGENLPAVVRGETTLLEHMRKDNMLDEYYVHAVGFHPYMNYLGRLIGQIVHRYPHMNILEIGAGTGGATKYILREIEDTFVYYSFTDISSGFFEEAQRVFAKYSAKMRFKSLNIEKDPTTQDFEEHSYDLIIASLVLHATENLEETLKNARKLLKPGGYLVILEITNLGQARLGFVFGGLPGWWLGRDDGRILTPCVTAPEWDKALSNSGFGGIETITPDLDPFPFPISVFAAQAIDNRVNFLQNPLSSPLPDSEIDNLTILGGASAISLQLVGKVIGLVQPFVRNIHHIESLDASLETELPHGGTVLSLLDLDARVFKPLSSVKIQALKTLFQNSKTIVWITRNARNDDPIAGMMYGFGRTLLLELPHLRLQFLDLGLESKADAKVITETLLRFQVAAQWEGKIDERLLWSTEPELAFEDGRYVIPRLKLQKARNARYNSAKRLIHRDVDTNDTIVKVSYDKGKYTLRELPPWVSPEGKGSTSYELVNVAFSSLQAIKTPISGHLFLVLGYNQKNEPVVAFSEVLQSRLWLPSESLVSIQRMEGLEVPQFLINFILAKSILAPLSVGDRLVVLDATEHIRHHLKDFAKQKGVDLTLLTSAAVVDGLAGGEIQVHPNAARRAIQSYLPSAAAAFTTFSEHQPLAQQIFELLPGAKFDDFTTLARQTSRPALRSPPQALVELLHEVVNQAQSTTVTDNGQSSSVLSLEDFPSDSESGAQVQLINWQDITRKVPVQVDPVDAAELFESDKTYWLVGLTGGLGLSLCSWMVSRGARHIVISSRNPKVDSTWLESLTKAGANIYVWANDITKRESVQDIFKRITTTLPPLAGIAQGAMVLHDSLFVDLDFEKIYKVLAPKCKGSQYLEECLEGTQLDFYIFFSSMVAVTGNGGQSHYSAANSFMTTLAAQRRKQGLAASVIHIGAIVGTGYVTRELTETQQKALRSYGNIWMSEQDFHQIFAEAVISSHPRSNLNHEIMTGLRIVDSDAPDPTTWFNNPKFSHQVVYRGTSGGLSSSTSKAGAPVRVQLHGATSSEQIAEILRNSFTYKLQLTLQMNAEEAKARFATLDAGADELGIDSLVAVEIRSWFLKELEVDMPVLKILGGASLGGLLAFALEKLPPTIVPNLGKALDATASAEILKAPAPAQSSWEDSMPVNNESSLPASQNSTSPTPLRRLDSSSSSRSSSIDTVSSFDKIESVQSWDVVSETELKSPLVESSIVRTLKLSSGQSRFYFLQQYLTDKSTFNITCSISLEGKLRVPDLELAVIRVGDQHTALRTVFFVGADGEPRQGILSKSLLQLEQKAIQSEDEISSEFEKMKGHVFDLEKGELMRIILLSLSPSKHQLIIGYHHINFDGISLEVFLKGIQNAYDGYPLSDKVLQYSDYALRQDQKHESGQLKSELSFWRKKLANLPAPLPLLPLSSKTSRQPLTSYAFHHVDFRLDTKLARAIEAVSRKVKSTPFHFHLAALKTLVLRNVHVDDFCIGIADGNRNDPDTLNSLGSYVNLLPLRFKASHRQTFVDAIKEAKANAYEALSYPAVPFDVLLSELAVPRSASHTPIFQVLLNYRLGIEENRPFCGCATEGLQFESGRTSDDIVLDIVDNVGGNPLLRLNVQQSLYTTRDAETLLHSYINLLNAFSRNPEQLTTGPSLYKDSDVTKAIELGRGKLWVYRS
jgi:hybrid polyketide synthase / nonribosomal peptide synthetase ACE1